MIKKTLDALVDVDAESTGQPCRKPMTPFAGLQRWERQPAHAEAPLHKRGMAHSNRLDACSESVADHAAVGCITCWKA